MYISLNNDGKRVHKDKSILTCTSCSRNHYKYEHNSLQNLGWGPQFNIPISAHKNVIKNREKDKDFYYSQNHSKTEN